MSTASIRSLPSGRYVSPDVSHLSYASKGGIDNTSNRRWNWLGSTALALPSIALVVLKGINPADIGFKEPFRTAIPFAAGILFQTALQIGVSRERGNHLKSLFGDNGVPLFFITTQILANTALSKNIEEGVFSGLTTIAGMATALTIHAIITRKHGEGRNDEVTDPLISEKPEKNLFFKGTKAKCILAAGYILSGVSWCILLRCGEQKILRDYGFILIGTGVGQLVDELSYHKSSNYLLASKVALTCAHFFPGLLYAGAEACEVEGVLIAPQILYALIGICNGFKSHIDRLLLLHASEDDMEQSPLFFSDWLYHTITGKPYKVEDDEGPYTITSRDKARFAMGGFRWLVAVGTIAYLGLGIAGYDFQNGKFDQFSKMTVVDLMGFGLSMYTGYFASGAVKHIAGQSLNDPLTNEVYFLSRFSIPSPDFGAYILTKMKIGDYAQESYSSFYKALSAIAYASLGKSVGLDAGIQGAFPHPRLPNAIFFLLYYQFIFRRLFNEIKV